MQDLKPGVLVVEEPSGVIDPQLGSREFGETPLGQVCGLRLDGMRTRYFMEDAVLGGQAFKVEIVYDGERMERVDLCVKMPGDKKGWDGWTEEGERRRKGLGEAWIAKAFGATADAKPITMEDGVEVVPFENAWDSPRRVLFHGGEVVSYYDSKAGFAGVVVRYGEMGADQRGGH